MHRLSRIPRSAARLSAALLAAVGVGAAMEASAASSSRVLTTAITANLSPLDPDTYYEAQGLPITQGAYQTLLTYAPNSAKLVPLLATSWRESGDGLTYTFILRHGVRFSDGTPFNAAAAESSFQRRTALKGGPSYQTAQIKSYSTPGPYTLVIHMKQRVAPFLDYLASPYGPMMSSPTGEKRHAVKGDLGSHWLATNSDGTGPYVLSSVRPGVVYTMTANPHYWGKKPYYTTVNFDVVPNPEQEVLEVENGQLSLMFGSEANTRDLNLLATKPNLKVINFPALLKWEVWVNPASRVFGAPAMRAALRAGLNNTTLTQAAWGKWATPSTNVYPGGMLPDGAAPDRPAYDPAKLKAALAKYKGKSVVIGWYNASDQDQTLADLMQVELQADGVNATLREYSPAVLFSLPTTPAQRPDILALTFNPDAAAPDTFARIYWYKNAPVNLLGCTAPAGDAALDEALTKPNSAAAEPLEVAAAKAYRDSNCWLNIADIGDPLVIDKNISGFRHELPWVLTTDFSTMHPAGTS
jgi:peptide/nickel transport system substrate-binding protein